jgi:predicted SPOUT superfamily RNA methylase MTH1
MNKRKKGQLSVSDTKKYWGYSDKEWEDLSDYEKNKAKTQAKVDKDNKYAEKMDNSFTKKSDNSMLIGGLAGVILGIILKK